MNYFTRRLFPIFFIFSAIVVGGCAKFAFQKIKPALVDLPVDDWSLAGGGADRVSQRRASLALPLRELARLKMTSALGQNLIISDGILYVPTLDGRLAAIDLEKRKIFVRKKLPQAHEAACAVLDSSLIIAQRFGNQTLHHYNIRTGKLLWSIDGGDIATEPIVTDSAIFIAALYRHVDAYRRADGQRLWQYRAPASIHSSPALAQGVLVVGTDDGMLVALEARTGVKKWELQIGSGIYASPIIRQQTIFVGTLDQEFLAIDLMSGEVRWRVPVGGKVVHGAAADDSLVVLGANDGHVTAVDAATGAVRWGFRAESVIGTSPIIAGDQVYFGSLDHSLYCLDILDGKLLWQRKLEGRVRTNPIVWDNYLVAACEDNLLYIFSPSDSTGSL